MAGYTDSGSTAAESTAWMHCEFEGDRPCAFCDGIYAALAALPVLGSVAAAICLIPLIGWLACAIGAAVALLIVLAILAAGWLTADDGSPSDAAVSPSDGDLHAEVRGDTGSLVAVTGDWAYDAGHDEGWNEIHPATRVQKLDSLGTPTGTDGAALAAFGLLLERWRAIIAEADAPRTKEEQEKPEHHWKLHPYIDGCDGRPAEEGPR